MNDKKIIQSKNLALIAPAIILSVSSLVNAHGFVEQPKARQQICTEQGGYWWPEDGSGISNLACRFAFVESGTFQFVQNIEFSKNVVDYNNINAVKAGVPNGTLCASADHAKRGMDLASTHWQKTIVIPDGNNEMEFLFFASTPHDPSFWEFYLTYPSFNSATQVLTWQDLQLIDSKPGLPLVQINGRNMYQGRVKIPVGRSGDAVLFTRWQREDAAGEGFYNCSDISINGSTTPPSWFDKGFFVEQGLPVKVGDEVWFRVFNEIGSELVFEKLSINEQNQSTPIWANELAAILQQNHSAVLQVGQKQANGDIVYSTSNLSDNKVWLASNNQSFALDVKVPQENLPPIVSLPASYSVAANGSIQLSASASDPEGQALSYQWTLPSVLSSDNLSTNSILVQANAPAQTTQFNIQLSVSDGVNSVIQSTVLNVIVNNGNCQQTDPNAGNYPVWSRSATYQAGAEVSNEQLVWRAKWWNQNSAPSLTSQVWQLISDVDIGWHSGIAYQAGSEVDHNGRRWKANWWTQSQPGLNSDWADIGAANCGL